MLALYLALQALDMGFGVQKVVVAAAQPLLDLRRGLLVQLLLLRVLKSLLKDIDTASFTQPPNACRPRALS